MKASIKAGFDFEKEVAEKLKGQGFAYVNVTKASREYGADIQAFKEGLEYVVQCKKYAGTVGYDAVKDIEFLTVTGGDNFLALPDRFFIFFPDDAHRPGLKDGENSPVRKVVVKVKID